MSENLKCYCESEYFVPVYKLRRDEEGRVYKEHDGMNFMCVICGEINTFYTEK